MPRKLVFAAWDEVFPDRKPRVLQPRTRSTTPSSRFHAHPMSIGDLDVLGEATTRRLSDFAEPFAEQFLVSPIAMRIRLEKLGLLHREVPLQRFLPVARSPFFEENVKCQLDR